MCLCWNCCKSRLLLLWICLMLRNILWTVFLKVFPKITLHISKPMSNYFNWKTLRPEKCSEFNLNALAFIIEYNIKHTHISMSLHWDELEQRLNREESCRTEKRRPANFIHRQGWCKCTLSACSNQQVNWFQLIPISFMSIISFVVSSCIKIPTDQYFYTLTRKLQNEWVAVCAWMPLLALDAFSQHVAFLLNATAF